MIRSEEDRRSGGNHRGSRLTRESKVVKSKR